MSEGGSVFHNFNMIEIYKCQLVEVQEKFYLSLLCEEDRVEEYLEFSD